LTSILLGIAASAAETMLPELFLDIRPIPKPGSSPDLIQDLAGNTVALHHYLMD
jgi:hypothetical protein